MPKFEKWTLAPKPTCSQAIYALKFDQRTKPVVVKARSGTHYGLMVDSTSGMQTDPEALSRLSQAVSQLIEPSLQQCFTVDGRSARLDTTHEQGLVQALSRSKDAVAQHFFVQLMRYCPGETVDRLCVKHQCVHKLATWLRASRSAEFELDALQLLVRLKVPDSLARRVMLVPRVKSVHRRTTGEARSLASQLLQIWNVEASEAAAFDKGTRYLEKRATHVSLEGCLRPPTWCMCLMQGSDGMVWWQEHGGCSRRPT